MKLKEIRRIATPSHGLSNNWGEETTIQYRCPCGKGTVTTEIESMVGHKQICTTIDCPACSKEYRIINPMSRNWEIRRISFQ